MSFDGRHFDYRYNPNGRTDHGITGDWIIDQYDVDVSLSHHGYDASNSSLVPMRRYMGEPDMTFFNAPAHPNTARLPPFQTLDIAPYAHPSSTWPFGMGPELPSPSLSGPTSSYFSSAASDRQTTPSSPPETRFTQWSPDIMHAEHVGSSFGGGHELLHDQKQPVSYPCVALHDVQSYEDLQSEHVVYEDEEAAYYHSYASVPQEGFHPVEQHSEDVTDAGAESDDNDSKDDEYTPQSPNIRRRRPQATRAVTSPRAPSKVTKTLVHRRRSSAPSKPAIHGCNAHNTASTQNRAFPCALASYGCTATFGSKNEWKRHVNTQHMRLAYWRCDLCPASNRKPNDFNRKDLFIQHVRRMHPLPTSANTTPAKKASKHHSGKPARGSTEEQTLNAIAERSRQDRAPPAQSGCHFCDETFDAAKETWDKRLEHVAQHMENAKRNDMVLPDASQWAVDSRLERWLVENEIVERGEEGGLVLK